MSVQALTWAFAQRAPSSGAKLLLVAIANQSDKAGVCFVGHESFAADCDYRRETVSQNMGKLEKAGLITRFQRRRKNGSRTSDWTVLAPLAANRGELIDADPDEYPEEVAAAARSCAECSREEIQREEMGPDHVGNSGGPDPLEDPEKKTPSSSRGNEISTEHLDLCRLLAESIRDDLEQAELPPKWDSKAWTDAARRLVTIGPPGYKNTPATVDQVKWVIGWLGRGSPAAIFWRPNIRSMPTLREKWDQLKAKIKEEDAKRQRPATASNGRAAAEMDRHRRRAEEVAKFEQRRTA